MIQRFILFFIFLLLVSAVFTLFLTQEGIAQSNLPIPFYGWLWPSNLGWVSVNCNDTATCATSFHKVELDGGKLIGYAWTPNIGWIKFDPAGDFTKYPSCGYPESPCYSAKLDVSNKFFGWVRACSVFVSGCSGTFKPDYERGGFDGWIKLTDIIFNGSEGKLTGFAWGATPVGWLNFQSVSTTLTYVTPYATPYEAPYATPVSPFCGDGQCLSGETCSSCAEDCGSCPVPPPVCGDGQCVSGESCSTCSADCGSCGSGAFCGDTQCSASETCSSCAGDCGACVPPPPAGFDYSFSASGDITLVPGGEGTNVLTASLTSGTSSPISFTVSGLPAGTTVSFNPISCSPTCFITHTVTTSKSTPPGSFPVSITANPLSKTASYTLNLLSLIFVNLSASPTSGDAPLTTTLTATVTSSTGSGDYIYTFDCDGQGPQPSLAPIVAPQATASASCTYTSSGSYIPTVTVERQGAASGTASITINVKPPLPKYKEVAPANP